MPETASVMVPLSQAVGEKLTQTVGEEYRSGAIRARRLAVARQTPSPPNTGGEPGAVWTVSGGGTTGARIGLDPHEEGNCSW